MVRGDPGVYASRAGRVARVHTKHVRIRSARRYDHGVCAKYIHIILRYKYSKRTCVPGAYAVH